MIDEVDLRMKAWVGRIATEAPVYLGVPDRESLDRGVCLYLLELGPAPLTRAGKRGALQFTVCYLVTVGAETPERAHRLLGDLVFAAMSDKELEVDLSPVPAALWAGLRSVPRPAFRLRVQVRKEKPLAEVRCLSLVEGPSTPPPLLGRVVGPGDVPIQDAWVALPSLQLSTRTDAQGQFLFPRLPPVESLGRLEVRAEGELLSVESEGLATGTAPLIIRMPVKEE
ncbi:carboxypeptidase-like regulatory domain-containing protein [Corallococcus carmarthensis]|uniref:Carboxypeptidase regulatory-like domain-containing protein n=1 Tax=Corallococcus carmarthensis TaxID=2316728 RepID=A0A3A8JSV0_9BACT|nr:carboxypeptidase-like regulatory domain-containing protein [Corallococcus carmarthensis]NOK22967.1 carboxypeptidase regulatory-like domain-containing protein [Corallococcus carmarthensis]RKG98917.1 carboxypeptidase regulatory-like domain-containing protein [Corallococcus carmarthensis]